jgi:hypothetical protein
MSRGDEGKFLAFVRAHADIQILVAHAASAEGLFLEELPADKSKTQFFLWNRSFPWTPDVGQTTLGNPYLRNIHTAPVIEYCRRSHLQSGRLFWSKGLAPEGEFSLDGYPYAYDAQRFEGWYDQVIAWVKANSTATGPAHRRTYRMRGALWGFSWFDF